MPGGVEPPPPGVGVAVGFVGGLPFCTPASAVAAVNASSTVAANSMVPIVRVTFIVCLL